MDHIPLYFTALLWSPDIEVRWRVTTDYLFATHGVYWVRLLPPHIALMEHALALSDARLDTIRRTHTVPVRSADHARVVDDCSRWHVEVESSGLDSLRDAIEHAVKDAAADGSEVWRARYEGSAVMVAANSAAIRGERRTIEGVPLPPPFETSALWLAQYQLVARNPLDWREGVRWRLIYRRRLRNAPPPRGSVPPT